MTPSSERSNQAMRAGSLFSGYGGLDLAVEAVTGAQTVWVSDIDPGACKILAHHWPDVPNLGDIAAVDWSQVEPVDVVTGGFPCQDVSHAGKRAGLRPDTRTGLWSQMAYAIDQLRPSLVVAENVRGLLSAEAHGDLEPCPWCVGDGPAGALRALGAILGDLADLGYDAEWVGLRAADVGAPHGRFRVFVVAYPAGNPWRFCDGDGSASAHSDDGGPHRRARSDRWPIAVHRPAPGDVADASGDGWDEGRPEPARLIGRPDAPLSGDAPTPDTEGHEQREPLTRRARWPEPRRGTTGATAWGIYAPAIARWERTLERPAPAPLRPDGKDGAYRLNPAAVEWMMGLPAGWVCDVPGLTRNEQLKALGNGVVPQQAAAALAFLLQAIEVAA